MQTASFDLEEATGSAQQVSLSIDFGWLGAEKASFGDVLTSVLSKLPDASDVLASMLSKLLDASDVLTSMQSKLPDASDVLDGLSFQLGRNINCEIVSPTSDVSDRHLKS